MGNQEGRVELELPTMLTDDEVQSRGSMLVETIWAVDATNSERTSAMKTFKERLVGLNEQQRKLAVIIRERSEPRMVSCMVLFHTPCEGIKRVIRMDTGEVVREETMTNSEKQLNLFARQSDFAQFMEGQGISESPDAAPPPDSPLNPI
jgi:hypothetical protein